MIVATKLAFNGNDKSQRKISVHVTSILSIHLSTYLPIYLPIYLYHYIVYFHQIYLRKVYLILSNIHIHMPHKFELLPLLTGEERFGCPRQPNVTAGVVGGEAAECILDFRREDRTPAMGLGFFNGHTVDKFRNPRITC